jgi:hypothetical protein
MKPRYWMVIPALLIGGAVGMVNAKLPPLSDEAKAKAEQAAAKKKDAAKKATVALEKAQDRAVANYKKGPSAKPATAAVKKK